MSIWSYLGYTLPSESSTHIPEPKSEVKVDEVKVDEVKVDEVKVDEVKLRVDEDVIAFHSDKHDVIEIIESFLAEIEAVDRKIPVVSEMTSIDKCYDQSTQTDVGAEPVNRTHRELVATCLDIVGLVGEEFCKQMVKAGGLMAGSFPLQCLLSEYYAGGDINVYFNYPPCYYAFANWFSSSYECESQWYETRLPFVTSSRVYQVSDQTSVNLVLLNTIDLKAYVNDNFDFSFCQTTFDGEILAYDELSTRKVGKLCNLNMSGPRPLTHLIERIRKYQERDFLIIDGDKYLDAYHSVHHKKETSETPAKTEKND